MTSDFVQVNGIKLFTNVGLWPYNDDRVRLWSGSIRIDATHADSDHWYKVRCSCHKSHMPFFRCTHGTGELKAGEVEHLSLKVPEPAIGTAIMTVIIDNIPTELSLYKLGGAEELFFGTGGPKKLVILKRSQKKTLWENFDEHRRAFEAVSSHIKPIFQNAPNGLSAYVLNSSTRTSRWQLLNQIIYPVVLELLQELGDVAKEETKTIKNHAVGSKWPSRNVEASDVTEMVLLRLSKKLQEEYKNSNSTPDELTQSL